MATTNKKPIVFTSSQKADENSEEQLKESLLKILQSSLDENID